MHRVLCFLFSLLFLTTKESKENNNSQTDSEEETQTESDKEKEILTSRHNENLRNILLVSSFITLLLLFLSVYISNIIERKFKKYFLRSCLALIC